MDDNVSPPADREAVVVLERRSSVAAVVALGLVVLAMSAWLVIERPDETGIVPRPIALGMAAIAGVGAVGVIVFWGPLLVRSRRVLLVIDEGGFVDRSSSTAVGRVPWRDVCDIGIRRINSNDNVVVSVVDGTRLQAHRSRVGAFVARYNQRADDVFIPTPTTSLDASAIVDEMTRRWRAASD